MAWSITLVDICAEFFKCGVICGPEPELNFWAKFQRVATVTQVRTADLEEPVGPGIHCIPPQAIPRN